MNFLANKLPVILIFDIGKTNKKVLLFDEQYNIILEESQQFAEIKDEDGFPCEDVHALTNWVKQKLAEILLRKDVEVKAINFSAYGASFVHLGNTNKPLTPLYNYLKPYPEKIKQQFYNTFGNESLIAKQTASPVLGSLNSGMQLYRLKYEQSEIFKQIKHSLHLPQYLSFIITQQAASDITSIGCHTQLWDLQKNNYHNWVDKEEINKKFAPIYNSDKTFSAIYNDKQITAGIGLHDSSAALIPYLKLFHEPFVLISTGTWCISLNPFNDSILTDYELDNDCLCYLSYQGTPVKASRLFAGYEHEEQVKKLAEHFNKETNYYKAIMFNNSLLNKLQKHNASMPVKSQRAMMQPAFSKRSLHDFKTYEEAYHQLLLDIIEQQVFSTKLVLHSTVKRIFVDGGFSKNNVYMNLLSVSFPQIKVYAASVARASALGAALVLNVHLSNNTLPSNLIELKHYRPEIILQQGV